MLKPSHERVPEKRRLWRLQAASTLLLAGCFATQGCLFQKKARVFVPPLIAAKPTQPAVVDSLQSQLPSPPDIEGTMEPGESLVSTIAAFPPPPPPPVTAPAKPSAPKVVVVEPPPTPAPAPRPITVVTADERQKMGQQYDDLVKHVRMVLDRTAGRISPDLNALANNARTFLNQAEQERQKGDLPTAVSLATRADRFATDLSARLPQ